MNTVKTCGLKLRIFIGVIAGLGLVDCYLLYMASKEGEIRANPNVTLAKQLSTTSLPKSYCGLDFAAFDATKETRWGMNSRTYTYVDEQGTRFIISCDFPFVGEWHELTNCYKSTGWTLLKRQVSPGIPPEDSIAGNLQSFGVVTAEFKNDIDQRFGYLTFGFFDESGLPLEPQRAGIQGELEAFFRDRQRRFLTPRIFYQIQVWAVTAQPISDGIRDKSRELFHEALQDLSQIITIQASHPQAANH